MSAVLQLFVINKIWSYRGASVHYLFWLWELCFVRQYKVIDSKSRIFSDFCVCFAKVNFHNDVKKAESVLINLRTLGSM